MAADPCSPIFKRICLIIDLRAAVALVVRAHRGISIFEKRLVKKMALSQITDKSQPGILGTNIS
jgi:hypothetical protein